MLERLFRKKVCRQLRELNAIVIPNVASAGQYAGIPDVYIGHNYWQGFLEFKGSHTETKIHQEKFMLKLLERNVNVWIFRAPGIIQDPFGEDRALASDALELLKALRTLDMK